MIVEAIAFDAFIIANLCILAFICIFQIIVLIVIIGLAIWVFKDASSKGQNGLLWAALVFFTGVLGLIIYLVLRKDFQ